MHRVDGQVFLPRAATAASSSPGRSATRLRAWSATPSPACSGQQVLHKGTGSALARLYNIYVIPSTYLIDAQGRIAAKDLRGEEMVERVREVVDATSAAR